jgi:peptide/nickel transport system substrate-binding protein
LEKGEKMNKVILIILMLGPLLGSAILAPLILASPAVKRAMDLYGITIQGGSPQSVDYSWAYDTASGEIIQNTMDTLLMWNTESTCQPYIFALATSEYDSALNGTGGVMGSDPIGGLNFENTAQPGPNATYYWQYDFKVRQGVEFQPPYNYSLTTADVAYSFQRTILQDMVGGPHWMLQEPLLDQASGLNVGTTGGLADFTNATQLSEVGALVRDAVQYNATDVWFNIMFPGAYAPFLQILCQTWSAIESKQWIVNQVITEAGRHDWDGSFTNLTSWTDTWNPATSPLDTPTPMEYGSGPFTLNASTPDYMNKYWAATRNPNWWGGWPCFYPTEAGVQTAGYVNTVEVSWNYALTAAEGYFLAGDCDFIAVPIQDLNNMFKGGNSSNDLLDGVRMFSPLPTLDVSAYFFTFNINATTAYGPIGAADTFGGNLIPTDFFGNTNWGINVRKAFAQAFDYNTFLTTACYGEAIHPATVIIPGLNYYDPTVTGWSYNLGTANASLNLIGPDSNGKMLKDVGFTITLVTNVGAFPPIAPNLLKSAIESLNPLYHVNIAYASWRDYIQAAIAHQLPMFNFGWLADFPDPHNFVLQFYRTGGTFAAWQGYSNPVMDEFIDQGIAIPNGPARASIYHNIQVLAVQDCPSFTLDQPTDRHFEYDWVQGWYYNPAYPGHNFFNEYKFYYMPEAGELTQSQPFSDYLPADVNRDGTVNMKDIASVARSFGSSYAQPVPSNWVFVNDITNDRTINMKDIANVARQFGQTSPIGTWGPLVTISPITSVLSTGGSKTFTATVDKFHGNATGRVIKWYYGTLGSGPQAPPTLGGTGTTWTWTSIPAGASYVYCTVTDRFDGNTARASAGFPLTVTIESMHAGIYAS